MAVGGSGGDVTCTDFVIMNDPDNFLSSFLRGGIEVIRFVGGRRTRDEPKSPGSKFPNLPRRYIFFFLGNEVPYALVKADE